MLLRQGGATLSEPRPERGSSRLEDCESSGALASFATRPGQREPLSLIRLKQLGLPVDATASGAPTGRVSSLEPSMGDPRFISVLPDGDREPFWIDRRTMRAARTPTTSLASEQDVVRAADLADRVQLALGEPVLLRFAFAANRVQATHVERARAQMSFTPSTYRCVAPFIGDRSTLSPLSVDALDRALRVEEDRGDEHRVRRIFARAYRKVDAHHTPWSRGSRGRLGAAQRLLRVSRDVTLCLADARRFRFALAESITRHDAQELGLLDRQDLIEALRRRMSMVVSALVLLERSRMATLSLLPLLEQLAGKVERDVFLALAAPAYPEERAAIDRKLLQLTASCALPSGQIERPRSGSALVEWDRTLRTLRHVRSLGMDVRSAAMGANDEQLLYALHEVRARHAKDGEQRRTSAQRSLTLSALHGRLGPLGVGPIAAAIPLLLRLAQAKGGVAEGLSAALLRLRAAALEAGNRLFNDGMLERNDDPLYMSLEEIEQALEGELGAYAARARLRREDDRRWRNFRAPRVIGGRNRAPQG